MDGILPRHYFWGRLKGGRDDPLSAHQGVGYIQVDAPPQRLYDPAVWGGPLSVGEGGRYVYLKNLVFYAEIVFLVSYGIAFGCFAI